MFNRFDVMEYHLYDLTYEETLIIDNSLILKDFDRYKF